MLAEVRLVIAPKEARLTIRKGDTVIEDEVWSFGRSIGKTEATELAMAVFHDSYDGLQYFAHGDE
jgi:hypothetical protein